MFSQLKDLNKNTQAASQVDDVKEKIVSSPLHLPKKEKQQEKKQHTQPHSDVTTSTRHDVNLRKWRDVIEDTETHNSALRITNDERYAVEDLIQELRRKYKIKTSMNEIARLGLIYLIEDFKKERQGAIIIKVKKS